MSCKKDKKAFATAIRHSLMYDYKLPKHIVKEYCKEIKKNINDVDTVMKLLELATIDSFR